MGLAIKVEDLSKAYQIGQFNTGALSQDIERWWASVRGKEDPFLKIGETNNRAVKGTSNIVWSLKEINLEIEQGEAIGIIGKNGAGKSTLLKILSRVTSPTAGNIKIKGRVASLLEVGTGFHPELTGRENVFLNGTILGMRKREIKRRFDEIIDFSGVERYIDTPVKRYSSGMYVRLAFAVAAHLESEILIVDEVLAVGDAEFQNKCLGKMGSIQDSDGRTILFVSHNMNAVRSLCSKSLILSNGMLGADGNSNEIIAKYLNEELVITSKSNFENEKKDRKGPQLFSKLIEIELRNEKDQPSELFYKDGSLKVIFTIEILTYVKNVEIGYAFKNELDITVSGQVNSWDHFDFTFDKGVHRVSSELESLDLLPGKHSIDIWIKHKGAAIDDRINNAISFMLEEDFNGQSYVGFKKYSQLNSHKKCDWTALE